jgi:hypothetical protein
MKVRSLAVLGLLLWAGPAGGKDEAEMQEAVVKVDPLVPAKPKLLSGPPGVLQVGSDKQLFIDELFFAQKEGVRLVVNPPVKDPQPVLVADKDKPWELNRISAGNTVIDDGGEIKLYYDAIAPCPSDDRSRWLCLAVSKDGIHFDKPQLGIVPFAGRNDTNIVWPPARVPSHEPGNVFIDTHPRCPPEERYKLVYCYGSEGLYVAVSPDGLHWKPYEKPSFRPSDTTNTAFFDDRIGRYVGWVRINGPRGRSVGRCEFDDLRDWGPETLVFCNDDEDQRYLDRSLFSGMDHYNGGVTKYAAAPDVYFGFPAAYYHFHPEVFRHRGRGGTRSPGNDGNIEVQLMTSRDGIHWVRPDRSRPFLPRGPEGSWDAGITYVTGASSLLYRGDEVWLYYTAQPFTHGDYSLAEKEALGSVMRAVLRRDGFVSVDAGFAPGEFTTPPMVFDGRELLLNVDTGGGGHLRVELQNEQGQPLPGYTLADCDVVNGNSVRSPVSWQGQADVSALAGTPIRLRVQMRCAKLYAFQFVPGR